MNSLEKLELPLTDNPSSEVAIGIFFSYVSMEEGLESWL